jgi:hypothetical protein
MLAIREGLVRETLQTLQECGRRQGGECVVLWIADRDQPDIVSAARHPEHHSSRKGYEIASEWLRTSSHASRAGIPFADRRRISGGPPARLRLDCRPEFGSAPSTATQHPRVCAAGGRVAPELAFTRGVLCLSIL